MNLPPGCLSMEMMKDMTDSSEAMRTPRIACGILASPTGWVVATRDAVVWAGGGMGLKTRPRLLLLKSGWGSATWLVAWMDNACQVCQKRPQCS
jgi:hypothetical protein